MTAFLLIIVALLLMVRSLPIEQASTAMKGWISGLGIWGPIVLALIYIVATVLFVPGTILTVAAGAIFGLSVGTITVSVGSIVGASLAFLIARYVARQKVAEMAHSNRHFGAIDRAIEEGGWKIVGLLRLSPAVPFNLQNYLYGLTPVRFWPYVLTSWLTMLPGTFLYVYLGHVTGAAIGGNRNRSLMEWAMLAIGLLATVAVTVYVTQLARRKLQEQVDEANDSGALAEPGEERSDKSVPHKTGKTIVLSVTGVGLLVLSLYANQHSDRVERGVLSLFGPPPVEMREHYSDNPDGPSFDHSVLDRLLRTYVDNDGWIDYQGLAESEAELQKYLDSIAEAPFEKLGRNEKLALLINGYNAATLKLMVENLPISSIMDIPEAERWDDQRWTIGGNTWSLNEIEHQQIRPKFEEPRIHFTVVCAAVGCPPLRNEAYIASQIDSQLEQQSQYVHDHETWFQFDPSSGRLALTKLYSWYGGDFEQVAGSVEQFAARYSKKLENAIHTGSRLKQDWLPYDWSLNSMANRQPR